MFEWISYTSANNIPGETSFKLDRHASLKDAKQRYAYFCEQSGYPDSTMRLYGYSADAWISAQEFRDLGCPFDYPGKIIERGPRGGVIMRNA